MDELKINLEFEDIRLLKKSEFKNMIKRKIENLALKKLELKKLSHSKVYQIQHNFLKMQTSAKFSSDLRKRQNSANQTQNTTSSISSLVQKFDDFHTVSEFLNLERCKGLQIL